MAGVRAGVWARRGVAAGSVTLESRREVHSENKQGTAAHYAFGIPVVFRRARCPVASRQRRQARRTANCDAAIGQLARRCWLRGTTSATTPPTRAAVARGCAARRDARPYLPGCRDRNVGFSLARANDAIDAAIAVALADADRWQGAIRQNGDSRRGAAVADLTDLVDTDDWPPGTRLIVRREPRHAGAQRSLFPSDAYRYWGHWTDHAGGASPSTRTCAPTPTSKTTSKARGPDSPACAFNNLTANTTWVALVCWAHNLVRWFQQLCCPHTLAAAAPKRLRWTLRHTPARLVRSGRRPPSAYPPTTPAQHTSPASTTTSPPSAEHPTRRHKNITTATTNHPAGPPHAPPHQPQTRNNTPTPPTPNQTTPPAPNTHPKDSPTRTKLTFSLN